MKGPMSHCWTKNSGGRWISAAVIGWSLLVAAAAVSGCSAALTDGIDNASCAAGAQFRAHADECKSRPGPEAIAKYYEDETADAKAKQEEYKVLAAEYGSLPHRALSQTIMFLR
jgi:hypothetical protein